MNDLLAFVSSPEGGSHESGTERRALRVRQGRVAKRREERSRKPASPISIRATERTRHRLIGVMPILPGLGDWHHRVTTKSPEAQRYFDQGLRLTYGFNHDEAVRSFERAVAARCRSARCATGAWPTRSGRTSTCRWTPPIEPRALAASRQAVRLKGAATAGRARADRGDGGALRRAGGRQPRRARYRIRERDARRRATFPCRRRRAGAVRRRDAQPAAVEPVDPGRPAAAGDDRARRRRCRRRSPVSRTTPARATSTSTPSKRRRRPSVRCRAPSGCRG